MALTPAAAPRAVAPQRAARVVSPVDDAEVAALHDLILKSLDDDQAVEVVTIPLAGKTSIADHMVIASGRSTRQVASMAAKIAERIKQDLHRSVRIEGLPTADWVLIDAQDVVVHLFRPEVRHFYNLEKMWTFDGPSGSTGPSRAPPKVVAEAAPFDTDPEGHDEALSNEPGIDDDAAE